MARTMQRWVLATVVVGAMALTGCGDDDAADVESPAETTDQSDGSSGGAGVTITKDDGSSSQTGAGFPDDFPEAVVVPEGLIAPTANRTDLGGVLEFTVIGVVEAPPADVVADLESAYDDAPAQSAETGDVRSVTYEDVDGFLVVYSATENADANTVLTIKVRRT